MRSRDGSSLPAGRSGDSDLRRVIEVYSRPGCHLCDEALAILSRLIRDTPFRIELRNVEDRSDWEERYGTEIPVGVVAGRRLFKYRVDEPRVRRALRAVLEHAPASDPDPTGSATLC